jgi:NAD(P)-dependent dehydrogenase (short-subunit alcohol dehydrogenase family)
VLSRTPFGFASTADDVAALVDLTGKRAIVTGAATGIGVETVRVLANRGAEVTIAVRNLAAGERAAAGIRALTGNPLVRAGRLDLSDRRSINQFLGAWWGPLDILINNAAVCAAPDLQHTADGWELQFGTNFFGHFALTAGLFEYLAAASEGGRVVCVSCSSHLYCPVIFDDINFRFRPYDPMTAYGQSKTATTLLAVAVSAQWASAGIVANAVNPGVIATSLRRQIGGLRPSVERLKTVQQAAATTILAAVSPLLQGIGGRYFDDCNEAPVVDHRTADLVGVAPYALDPDNAERLWAHAAQGL